MNGEQQNPMMAALMGLAGQGGEGAQPGAPPGAGPGGPQPGGPQPGGPQQGPGGGPPPNPVQMIQQGLLAMYLGMSQLGLQETANDIVERVKKRLERLQKSSPQGGQGAALGSRMPAGGPPGVGQMPGMPGV